MASGVSSLDDINTVKDSVQDESPEAKKRREEREKQQAEKDKLDSFYKPNDKDEMFPVTSRVENGEGKKVEAEIESVLPKTAAPAADSSAAAPAAS